MQMAAPIGNSLWCHMRVHACMPVHVHMYVGVAPTHPHPHPHPPPTPQGGRPPNQ